MLRMSSRELDAVDEDAPGVVLLEAVDAADHRRLAGAGRADDDDDLLAGDVEVDVAQRLERAEELLHADQLEHHLAGAGHLRGVGEHWSARSSVSLIVSRPPVVVPVVGSRGSS